MSSKLTTLRFAIAASLLASATVSPAIAKDTRSSAAISKTGYKSDDKGHRGPGRNNEDRGPRDGFPDNHGQDQACQRANYHAPNHCHNDSQG